MDIGTVHIFMHDLLVGAYRVAPTFQVKRQPFVQFLQLSRKVIAYRYNGFHPNSSIASESPKFEDDPACLFFRYRF